MRVEAVCSSPDGAPPDERVHSDSELSELVVAVVLFGGDCGDGGSGDAAAAAAVAAATRSPPRRFVAAGHRVGTRG